MWRNGSSLLSRQASCRQKWINYKSKLLLSAVLLESLKWSSGKDCSRDCIFGKRMLGVFLKLTSKANNKSNKNKNIFFSAILNFEIALRRRQNKVRSCIAT
mmetsp:Transcript_44365/g.106899  ORF Transcript_44365/g.106899 Transcript_44365/m.106899 type:complete len:101 (-) Transcript_44365:9-311(-)